MDDYFTNTPEDAGRFEAHYGPEYDDDRPTLAELSEDEYDEDGELIQPGCLHFITPDDPSDAELSRDPWINEAADLGEPPF